MGEREKVKENENKKEHENENENENRTRTRTSATHLLRRSTLMARLTQLIFELRRAKVERLLRALRAHEVRVVALATPRAAARRGALLAVDGVNKRMSKQKSV